ncbi:triacylglycerol lipase [Streptomyces sp. TLI_185]|uniref:esterase/lipase family protein n=1 Tax=Streptomyces sp. TLI_185 TaxID=2485151 RepID=UPI000F50251D|nr:alpha/beta hydrolase [Streptomyces sp. TLI_185]RPF39359.1 alpha/beta hydrolase family protein [Streptomyces sp. TLI_185]
MKRLGNFGIVAAIVSTLIWPSSSPATAASAEPPSCQGQSPRSDQPDNLSPQVQPVVLVHGWTGNAGNMNPVKNGLEKRLNRTIESVKLLAFDYQAANFHWAANPEIAACLADYLRQVSQAHGNGKVLVVAHSLGGWPLSSLQMPGMVEWVKTERMPALLSAAW